MGVLGCESEGFKEDVLSMEVLATTEEFQLFSSQPSSQEAATAIGCLAEASQSLRRIRGV